MISIRLLRESRDLSQRALARRAGISFRTMQLAESGGHDLRWSTMEKLAKALEVEPEELNKSQEEERSLRACSQRIARDPSSWRIHLMDFVDAFRRGSDPAMVSEAPLSSVEPRFLALIAATVESLCAEARILPPWWCKGCQSLPEPWFVAGVESLKAMALVESPLPFRRRNIFVLGNFLSRA